MGLLCTKLKHFFFNSTYNQKYSSWNIETVIGHYKVP